MPAAVHTVDAAPPAAEPTGRRQVRLRRVVGGVLVLALVLRLAVIAATAETPVALDPADFSRTAWSIAQGDGFPQTNRAPGGGPSAYRPPAYPALLAGVYALAGEEAPPAGRALDALLGTLAVALTGLIAARIWGRRVGMIALVLAAVAPPMVVMSTALISEALFVPLVLGAILTALEARRSPHPLRWAAATGLLIGIAELTRTNAAVLLLPLGFAFWTGRPRWRPRALAAPALMVLVAVATVAPWTIRNALVLHAFVPVSTEIGYTIAGTYDQASRTDQRWPAVWKEVEHGASPEYQPIIFYASVDHLDEVTFGNRLQAQALAELRSHPAYLAKVVFWNGVRLFHLGELDLAVLNLANTGIPRTPALFEIYGFYPLLVLALGGVLLGDVRRAPRWLWFVALGLCAVLFVTSFIRFRMALDPFFVMLAALALATLPAPRLPLPQRRMGLPRR
jgi:4-amino-4-deoxy-L-arabinose transferase-like glycosyltransferase